MQINSAQSGIGNKFDQLDKIDRLIDMVECKAAEVFPGIKKSINIQDDRFLKMSANVKSHFDNTKLTNLV